VQGLLNWLVFISGHELRHMTHQAKRIYQKEFWKSSCFLHILLDSSLLQKFIRDQKYENMFYDGMQDFLVNNES